MLLLSLHRLKVKPCRANCARTPTKPDLPLTFTSSHAILNLVMPPRTNTNRKPRTPKAPQPSNGGKPSRQRYLNLDERDAALDPSSSSPAGGIEPRKLTLSLGDAGDIEVALPGADNIRARTNPTELMRFCQQRIFAVLTDPDCAALPVKEKILRAGLTTNQWYSSITPELIAQAVQQNRTVNMPVRLVAVDDKLAEMAERGSLGHMELFYERVEGYRRKGEQPFESDARDLAGAWDAMGAEERASLVASAGLARRRQSEGAAAPADDGAAGGGGGGRAVPDPRGGVEDVGQERPDPAVQALSDI